MKRTYHADVHSNETRLGRWHEYLNLNMLDQIYDRILKNQVTIDKIMLSCFTTSVQIKSARGYLSDQK